jgi:signal transduction histidine kinase/Tfp pilus assembly protein PilF
MMHPRFFSPLFIGIFFAITTLLMTPQYLAAQTYQQDTATIHRLIASAKTKRFSDSSTALKEANQALIISKKYNDGELIYQSYRRMARIHEVNDQDAKAHPFFLACLTVENQVNDDLKCHIYSEVGNSYFYVGNIRKAYEYFKKNYDLGITMNSLNAKQASCLQLGKFYSSINEFEKATQYIVKSLEYALQLNKPEEICESYRLLAGVYIKTKNYDLAYQSIEKSVIYIEKIDSYDFPHYFIYNSYGSVLTECGKHEKALIAFKKAYELCQKVGDKSNEGNILIGIADVYFKLNDIKNAELYYQKAWHFSTSFSNYENIGYNSSYGSLLVKKGEYDKAITYLIEGNKYAGDALSKIIVQKNYIQLSQAYEAKGDAPKSLFYLKKSVVLQDSIFSEENTKRIAEAQFKFDLSKSEGQVTTMKDRQMKFGIIGTLILLAFAVAFLIYSSRSKTETNKMLTDKNQEIKDKNRQLEESNEILKQFAYASAHDLKEPLRSINSFVNILQRRYMKDVPAEAHEYMGFVTTGVKRMESLLNALLEFSSVLTNEDLENKHNDVSALLKTVFYNHQNLINEKKAVIRTPSVFPTIFMGDTHLKLLFCNLVSNALKFSKTEAKIEINYTMTDDEIIIFVKDEGIGLDKSYGDKVFKLFQRLDRVSHKESAGIGLTLCKNIVDKYSGRIWFESVMNEGTTFFVAFPKSMISKIPVTKGTPQYLEHVAADLSAVSNI